MDCDGDRRDYAKAQWKRFLARDGKPTGEAAKMEAAVAK